MEGAYAVEKRGKGGGGVEKECRRRSAGGGEVQEEPSVLGHHLHQSVVAPHRISHTCTGAEVSKPTQQQKIKSQKDAADKLAKKLELDAIILSVDKLSLQAFINGKLQVEGDKLEVKLNGKKYELVVAEIFHNKVVLKWNEFTISVRMAKLDNVK